MDEPNNAAQNVALNRKLLARDCDRRAVVPWM
jgi:hypothetical protein